MGPPACAAFADCALDGVPYFDLRLAFSPAFHRGGAILVEGDATGIATFEAHATGLFPRLAFSLPVDAQRMAALLGCCHGMLAGWDPRWSKSCLDGIGIEGTFESTTSMPRRFVLWSPHKGVPKALLRAAFDCFPAERCAGAAETVLDDIRGYVDLQSPLTVFDETPIRLRLAPCVYIDHTNVVEARVRALPADAALVIDLSGVEGIGVNRDVTQVLPLHLLLARRQPVQWIAHGADVAALTAGGVDPAAIGAIDAVRMSNNGHPLVLGGVVVSCRDMIALARGASHAELAAAFVHEYSLTSEQAARASTELIGFMKTHEA